MASGLMKSGVGDDEPRILSLAEAAAKIDPRHLMDHLVKAVVTKSAMQSIKP